MNEPSASGDPPATPHTGGEPDPAPEAAAAPSSPEAAATPSSPEAAATPSRAPRRHRALIATLFVFATIFGILAVLAVWANRQALNTDNWTNTSTQLLANKEIQTAVAAYAVNQLFSSGVPQAEIKAVLPAKLQPLAGPISSGLQQLAGQVAPRVLASPQVQTAWREANRAAHATLLKIINGGGSLASTNGGVVTLNLHAIIAQLAGALGVQQQVAAVQAKLKGSAGQVTRRRLEARHHAAPDHRPAGDHAIRPAEDGAGHRRRHQGPRNRAAAAVVRAVRPRRMALAGAPARGAAEGRLVLRRCRHRRAAHRRLAGNEIINALVKNPDNKPAAHQVWDIATTLLYDIAVAVVVYGLVFVVAAWLAGHTRPATALRRALAPTLRTRPAATYGAVYLALLLVIFWGPTPATRQLPYIIVLHRLARARRRCAAGSRRQREFPDAQAGDTMRSIRASYGDRGRRPSLRPDAGRSQRRTGRRTRAARTASRRRFPDGRGVRGRKGRADEWLLRVVRRSLCGSRSPTTATCVREGLGQLLAGVPELDVVAVCEDASELLEAIERDCPDVVLTDIRMPPFARAMRASGWPRGCVRPIRRSAS